MSRQADWKFDVFFIWIYNHHKQIIGAGFLIGEKEIATCAHVVRCALGLHFTPEDAPEEDIVLSFSSSVQDSGLQEDGQYLLATAYADGWDKQKDIAILQLHSELPKEARPARLSADKTLEGHSFRVYGFPGETTKGVWAYGIIKDQRENGQVQLESATGYAVQGGFSGGPVFDDELKKVVGMIVTSDESVRVASMIPVDMLANVCCRAGVGLELDEENGDGAMNILPREICENCLKVSFSERDKQDFISLCMNHIPAVGRLLDEIRSIDWMINKVLDYSETSNEFERLWLTIKKSRPNQHQKFYQEWKRAVSTNR